MAAFLLCLGSACRSLPAARRAYDIEIVGAFNRAMQRDILAISDAAAYQQVPVGSVPALRRRVAGDAEDIRRYLRSRGYYAARVDVEVFAGLKRPRVVITLDAMHPFFIAESTSEVALPTVLTVPLEPPQERSVASFATIQEHGRILRRELQNKGFPLATLLSREVVADHAAQEVTVHYVMDPGPPARFGPVFIEGLNNMRPAFVRNLQPWEEGDRYRLDDIEEYRRRLARAGLFSTIEIIGADQVSEEEVYAFLIRLKELRRQTVRVGLDYRTDQGFEASAGWLFRNLTGRGERLEWTGVWAEERYHVDLTLRLPQIRNPRQSLLLNVSADREEFFAYTSRSTRAGVRFEREWSRWMTTWTGTALRYSEIEDRRRREEFWLLSFPLRAVWNTRDEALNPTRGYRLQADAEPFIDLKKQADGFLKVRGSGTGYLGLRRDRALLLALRATVGSIPGSSLGAIPADERFYAGGAQSIRGYGHQEIGPRVLEEPSGGRSLTEVSLELRSRWKNMGGVVFLDGGQAYEEALVRWLDRMHWGAGFGLRYFTPLGPIRADVGFPLNAPDYVDGGPQFYLSIGQAF